MLKLDGRCYKAIECIVKGQSIAEAGRVSGIAKRQLYEMIAEPEFKQALDRALAEYHLECIAYLNANLKSYIAGIIDISKNAKSEKIQLEALMYLVNRVLGNPTVKAAIEAPMQIVEADQVERILDAI